MDVKTDIPSCSYFHSIMLCSDEFCHTPVEYSKNLTLNINPNVRNEETGLLTTNPRLEIDGSEGVEKVLHFRIGTTNPLVFQDFVVMIEIKEFIFDEKLEKIEAQDKK